MPEYCNAERDGRILTVTINRPEVMNSLHPMANEELGNVFDDFVSDPDLWVAIITGVRSNCANRMRWSSIKAPREKCRNISTKNSTTAPASAASPNANTMSGMPILPELLNIIGGTKVFTCTFNKRANG